MEDDRPMNSSRCLPERRGGAPRWIGLFVLAATALVAAQVPLSKEPRHHMTFENPQLRIIDVNIPPGDKSLDHRHDLDIVTVSMSAGTMTRIQTGGQPAAERPSRPLGDATVAEYAGKAQSHIVENVGKSRLSVVCRREPEDERLVHRARSQRPGDEDDGGSARLQAV